MNVARNDGVEGTEGPLGRLADGLLFVAGLFLVALALIEGWQVFARYVLNDSPSWTEPMALLCMKFAMMLGAASAVRAERHFGFFIGVHAAPPKLRRVMLTFSRLTQAVIGLMLCYWGVQLCLENWDVALPGTALPQGAGYLPLVLGGPMIALFAIELVVRGRDVRPEGG